MHRLIRSVASDRLIYLAVIGIEVGHLGLVRPNPLVQLEMLGHICTCHKHPPSRLS
jgi:hypothetical protein